MLGIDTNNDNKIDSFFVDVHYLSRNTLINGVSAVLLGLGPETPQFTLHDEPTGLRVEITSQTNMPEFRVGIRENASSDFDAVYRFSGTSFLIPGQVAGKNYFVSVAAIDNNKIMSAFSSEIRKVSDASTAAGTMDNFPYSAICTLMDLNESASARHGLNLIGANPNPSEENVSIYVELGTDYNGGKLELLITDNSGKEINRSVIPGRTPGIHSAVVTIKEKGVYISSLILNGKLLDSKKFVVK